MEAGIAERASTPVDAFPGSHLRSGAAKRALRGNHSAIGTGWAWTDGTDWRSADTLKRLRVVHVMGTLGYAGLQRRVLELIKALPEFSHVVVVQSETQGPLYADYANACEVRQCAYRPGRRLEFFRRLTSLLREIQPDVVLAHLFGNHTLVSWASFVAGVPTTYGVSANDPVYYERSVWKPMLMAHAARPFCRGEIAVSHAVGQVLTSRLRLPARP